MGKLNYSLPDADGSRAVSLNDGRAYGRLMGSPAQRTLEESPGIQTHSVRRSPVLIFSVESTKLPDVTNERATQTALRILQGEGVAHGTGLGSYKGATERCIIVRCDTDSDIALVQLLARIAEQESILHLDGDRNAELRRPDGSLITRLGKFRAAPEKTARRRDSWTYSDKLELYFITDK